MAELAQIGRLIADRYRLRALIGRGGMGTVWLAGDELLGRDVAVKRLRLPAELSAEERELSFERTRREAQSASRITHPHVVAVHDVVDDPDTGGPCLVMEYVESTNLAEVLRADERLPVEEVVHIGLGMVSALAAAHAAGVLHRDMKPGNVLLSPARPPATGRWGRVVLTDFGIARTNDSTTLTRTDELLGSVCYVAPERVRGLSVGPPSDLYGLGVTLYQALEGHLPIDRPGLMETAIAVTEEEPPVPQRAGPLGPLLMALLRKDPVSRPSAQEVRAELHALNGARHSPARTDRVTSRASGRVTPGGTPGRGHRAGARTALPDRAPVPARTAQPLPPEAPPPPEPVGAAVEGATGGAPARVPSTALVPVARGHRRRAARSRARRRALLWSVAVLGAALALFAGVRWLV
ncbi:serine/threonine-protein kinase [Streptomyces sp. NPDC005438]|uniref:serine/threonine-protein kinase n=1 Tax=Streptomyces sp. NPDC005438 TaxID=3156880 RepID=UPI0033AC1944